ncbi:S16 family serine protease [Nitrospira sp. NS4]|uniref:S16 family serine protease n=1 Tax=Nitrospira sp. NS4 TaxID=3414498 RepID=UPI003C2AD8A3
MEPRRLCAAAGLIAVLLLIGENGWAGLWKCAQPDGSVLFSDGGGPGCREINALPELQSARSRSAPGPAGLRPDEEAASVVPLPTKQAGPPLSSRPFGPTVRVVPSLSYRDLPAGMRAKGWSIPNKGDITMAQIDVTYLPAGNGPQLSTDHHFMAEARDAFGAAVLAAARATQYDPRFLSVRLTMPVGSILHAGVRVDGPSAGVAWTVAVTSALLGDSLRQDVCLSGTMDSNLRVGWVGGLEHKIEGCHLLPGFREMLLPAGQSTFAITDKGMARSIKVTEVATFAEAYEITTGQSLRPAP